jgi:hypothetical protein
VSEREIDIINRNGVKGREGERQGEGEEGRERESDGGY